MEKTKCTICKYKFDLQGEGGTQGKFGDILVSLCPTWYSCLLDWVIQLSKEKVQDILNEQKKRQKEPYRSGVLKVSG